MPDIIGLSNFFSSEVSNRFGIYVNAGSNVSIKGNYFGGSAKFLGGTALKYTVYLQL